MLKRCYLVDKTCVDRVMYVTADYDLTPQRLKNRKVPVVQIPHPRLVTYVPYPRYRRMFRGQRLHPQSPLVFLAGTEDGYDDGSYREEYQYHGSGSSEDTQYGSNGGGGPKPDASYSFGYETETANRLEKADNQGNVRGGLDLSIL